MNPLLQVDAYKVSHWAMYPSGTEYVYSNTTPRKSRMKGINAVTVFGIQYFVKEYIYRQWNENFFSKSLEHVLSEYEYVIVPALGKNAISRENIEYLWNLGYLPIRIKALPEGTICPIRVPFMTIVNTDPKCYWLTNYLETISQNVVWKGVTSATIAHEFKKTLTKWAALTSDNVDFVNWQGHDFSMRGMSSFECSQVSGAAHLCSFMGSDTIPAIPFLQKYYDAGSFVGGSVPATEHSIQCAHYNDSEESYIQSMIDRYPEGIVSIVADGYDYWKFIDHYMRVFKSKIMGRNGKVVIRPDSGSPMRIICGYDVVDSPKTLLELQLIGERKLFEFEECYKTSDGYYLSVDGIISELEAKGSIQVLYEIFGGSENSKGYIDLDPHIGLIYGDSITLDLAEDICSRLATKGFSSTNVVFGIGSYTYTYNTRDTFGMACKATWIQVNGKEKNIFKDPKTGDNMKKSARGLLSVQNIDGKLTLLEDCSKEQEESGELKTVFENGVITSSVSLDEIRNRLSKAVGSP